MAETMLTCKPTSRKAMDGGDSSSSDSEVPEERSKKEIEEENQRKEKELEKEQRRLQKRIERKRRRTEEVGPSSSTSATTSENIIQEQFRTILKQLNSMKLDCAVCKTIEKPKSQLDFLKAIYIKLTAIEKLLKDVQP